jgi:hypothetical protein
LGSPGESPNIGVSRTPLNLLSIIELACHPNWEAVLAKIILIRSQCRDCPLQQI